MTREEALALIRCLIGDFEALSAGDWIPDEGSCEASIEAAERVQAFLEALPCAS